MSENPNQSKKVIAVLVAVLAVALAAWWFASKKTVQPTAGGGVKPFITNIPQLPPPRPLSVFFGNVTNISEKNQTITLGTYRVENNKAVLASTHVFKFNNDTVFAREQNFQTKSAVEDRITVKELKEKDPVRIQAIDESGNLVAKKIIVVTPPPPRRPL